MRVAARTVENRISRTSTILRSLASYTLVVLMLAMLVPETSSACSVCFSGRDENRIAFLVTTILMTFLPLIMIGGVIAGLRRRYLQLERAAAGDGTFPPLRLETGAPRSGGSLPGSAS